MKKRYILIIVVIVLIILCLFVYFENKYNINDTVDNVVITTNSKVTNDDNIVLETSKLINDDNLELENIELTEHEKVWYETLYYPITQKDEEWADYTSKEMIGILNMPESLLTTLSTEELAKLAVEYPYISRKIFMPFDLMQNYESLVSQSNIIVALIKREDAKTVLFNMYINMSVDYEMLNSGKEDLALLNSGFFKEIFLESYLGMNMNLYNLEELNILNNKIEDNYNKKEINNFTVGMYTIYFAINAKDEKIPKELIPDKYYDGVIERFGVDSVYDVNTLESNNNESLDK